MDRSQIIRAQEKRVIKENLKKLTERMKKLGYNSHMIGLLEKRVNELQRKGVYGVNQFIQKLLSRVTDKESYSDILIEGRFAIILSRNGFSEICIEYCEKGPDMKVEWDKDTVYFELMRRRPSEDDEQIQSEAIVVSPERPVNIISKIQSKMPQLQSGKTNIIVYWSDTLRLSACELKEAFEYLKQEIKQNPGTYKDLSAILFTEGEESYRTTLKKFYLFKNEEASKPVDSSLAKKLESLQKQDFKKLQREDEAIAAAMKRL